jgi:predicted neutral ceramidase superfamily lipid hydrolase
MKINSKQIKFISVVFLLTTILTWFYYAHETLPKPLRAVTALFATPVAIASGLSHYLNLGLDVYETPWAVIFSNLVCSTLLVYLVDKLFNRKK